MKKMILACVCALALAGCGGMSDAERLSAYVQGYLDLTYKDEIGEDFLEIAGISEDDAHQQYQDGLKSTAIVPIRLVRQHSWKAATMQ